ncbi:MAG: class I SAM-dependent methyltransferase [Solirubrobacteraceae bacterium]
MSAAQTTYRRTIRALPRREELPKLLNRRGLLGDGAEIGVARGDFSELLLDQWKGRRLYSIDPWIEFPPGEYVDACDMNQDSMDDSFTLTKSRLNRFGDRSAILRQTGQAAAANFAPGCLDFVYIDARHNYEAVLEDLADWFPLVRSGGILAGHDYNDGRFVQGDHGVRRAVNEFFPARGIKPAHTYTDVPSISWLVEKP